MSFDCSQLTQAGNLLSSLGNIGSLNSYYGLKREIITVNGLQEAKDFKLNKNERIALIDSNDDILYIKECDDIGKYNLKVYRCSDVTEEFMNTNAPANISKTEFDNLMSDMCELKKMMQKVVQNGKYNVQQQKQQNEL